MSSRRAGAPVGYLVTLASPRHLKALPAVELGAASRFAGWDVPSSVVAEATALAKFESAQAAGHVWVALAGNEPVGFGLVVPSGDRLHLMELDVVPEHGGRGLGAALVSEIASWAAANGFVELTLTTYRDVPWNAPFYVRLGFEIISAAELDAELSSRLRAEAAGGLDSMARVALRRRLHPTEQQLHLKVRRFKAADLAAVQRLIHDTIDRRYTGVYPPRAVQFFKEFHSRESILERHEAGAVLVVADDHAVVATGAIVAGEISGVFVRPRLQGRGIGEQVMDRLEALARAEGRAATTLAVSLPSRGFYEHRGYRVLASRSIDVGSGERLDYWEAEKRLDEGHSP